MMSAPQKPWEAYPTVLNSNSGASVSLPLSSGGGGVMQSQQRQVQLHTAPPPLPPRLSRTSAGSLFGSSAAAAAAATTTRSRMMHGYPMGSYMGSYGPGHSLSYATSYGSLPDYSPYGIARRLPDDLETRFIQMAEESSALAFQSIEAFVRSFSSVTMMLESTYQAMYMSFRAVLSVAENVARLRGLFRQFLTSFAVLKTVAWFYNRLRYLLGLISGKRLSEDAWKIAKEEVLNGGAVQAAGAAAAAVPGAGAPPSRTVWPLVTFFGLMLGGPYLVFKFAGVPNPEQEEWRPLEPGESTSCIALYDFETCHPGELAFRRGDTVLVAADPNKRKKQGGWILAARQQPQPLLAGGAGGALTPPTLGYIPVNRIGIPRTTTTTTTTTNNISAGNSGGTPSKGRLGAVVYQDQGALSTPAAVASPLAPARPPLSPPPSAAVAPPPDIVAVPLSPVKEDNRRE